MLLPSLRRVRAQRAPAPRPWLARGGGSDKRPADDASAAVKVKMDATLERLARIGKPQQAAHSISGQESSGEAMAMYIRSFQASKAGEGRTSSSSSSNNNNSGDAGKPGPRKRPHWSTLLLAFLAFEAAAYAYYNDVLFEEWQAVFDAARRSSRLGVTVARMVADYYQTTRSSSGSSPSSAAASRVFVQLNALLVEQQRQQEMHHRDLFSARARGDRTAVAASTALIEHTRLLIEETSEKIAEFVERKNTDLSALHTRNAKRLKAMCEFNRGIYIKLGQHLSMLDHIIPPEYQEELSGLLASNPTTPYAEVERVFDREFGKEPLELFDSFEREPIASASLAQVHVAYKDGVKYAVKVQHPGLREAAPADIYVVSTIVETLSLVLPGFNYSFLSTQLKKNLPKELDFVLESYNIARCRLDLDDFIQRGDVAVPTVYRPASGRRVLTMSFEEGDYISNSAALCARGLQSADVARVIAEVFCHQIFKAGFVHSDPHEANLLVRVHPTRAGRPQLVLLDHGLYQELPPAFRKEYCRLWFSLCMSDEDGIKRHCQALGAGPLYTLFSAMLTMKPWEDIVSKDIARLRSKGTAGEHVVLTSYVQKYFKDIMRLLGALPSELLLVLKANDCIRHIDRKLGVPINSAIITMHQTGWTILLEDWSAARQHLLQAAPGELAAALAETSALGARLLRFLLRIGAMEMASYLLYFRQACLCLLSGNRAAKV